MGDYTTQLCGDYNKPLQGWLFDNQYFMESKARFFLAQVSMLKVAEMGIPLVITSHAFSHSIFRKF